MSVYCNNNNIMNYLIQLEDNPYLAELKQKIFYNKRKFLKKIWSSKLLEKIDDYIIDIIFNNISFKSDLYLIEKNFDKINTIHFEQCLQKLLMANYNIQPTPLRISTMTICCFLGVDINSELLFPLLKIEENVPDVIPKIVGIKYNNSIIGYFKNKNSTSFFNSITLNILINNKYINLKIFDNGKIQMTGVIDENHATLSVNLVKNILSKNKNVINNKEVTISDYKIALINSDYDCGFKIHREELLRLLTHKYKLSVTYDPENYPGVKLQYFWNDSKTGICNCPKKCSGKGDGLHSCKKVTISTFQSGKIIITGGNNREQLNDTYQFINKILYDNIFIIKKKYYIEIEQHDKILLKKNNIENYEKYSQYFEHKNENEFQ